MILDGCFLKQACTTVVITHGWGTSFEKCTPKLTEAQAALETCGGQTPHIDRLLFFLYLLQLICGLCLICVLKLEKNNDTFLAPCSHFLMLHYIRVKL